MTNICLLGSPHLKVGNNKTVKLPTQKCALLLGYLVFHRDVRLDRTALASWLWPDHNESRARRNLNNEVWRLRQYLRNALVADSWTITFAPDGKLFIDVDLFERVDEKSSIAKIEQAISLYKGDFMSGFFEDWVLVKREYYADRLVQYLDRCAVYYQGIHDVRKAVACVRGMLLRDPVNETCHRRLMLLYIEINDFYSAITQYRECVEILERELNVSPLPETQSLYDEICLKLQNARG